MTASDVQGVFAQAEFEVRCEWGLAGVRALAPVSDAVVLVDVLSFTTCVDIATANGAFVLPYRSKDAAASDFARSNDAVAAGDRESSGFTLSPASLLHIPSGTRLVLPSPNGATLSLAEPKRTMLAACLRNYRSVAAFASATFETVAVVPCGERWPDGSLRPAIEDWLGAGAVIGALKGRKSAEALAAERVFETCRDRLEETILAASSGRELAARGFAADVSHAARLDCSASVPVLNDGAYSNAADR